MIRLLLGGDRMHEFKRGEIISKNENLDLIIEDFYIYNGQIKRMNVEIKDGILSIPLHMVMFLNRIGLISLLIFPSNE